MKISRAHPGAGGIFPVPADVESLMREGAAIPRRSKNLGSSGGPGVEWRMKLSEDAKSVVIVLTLASLVLAGFLGVLIVSAHMEARSFRKLTGRADVTWFDALWVELRVDCEK